MKRIGRLRCTTRPTSRGLLITIVLALAVLIPAFGPAFSPVHALNLGKPGARTHSTPQPLRKPKKESNTAGGTILWGFGTNGMVSGSPTVVNGVVYVGTSPFPPDDPSQYAAVYALNANNGNPQWSYRNTGISAFSAPTVANGVVYVSADDATGNAYFVDALDATNGVLLWSYQTTYGAYPPIVANGVVYATTNGGPGTVGLLYALNANNGALLWKYSANSGIQSYPSVFNGSVFFSTDSDFIYAIGAANGVLRWRYQTTSSAQVNLMVNGGVVYAATGGTDYLYALNATTGALLWRYQTGSSRVPPTVANGVVYVSGSAGDYALSALSGTLLWHLATGVGNPDSPLTVANGRVYGFGYDAYALDATTGVFLWGYYANETPIVADGVLYDDVIDSLGNATYYAVDATSGVELWSVQNGGGYTGPPVVVNGVEYAGVIGGVTRNLAVYAFAASPPIQVQGPIGTERYGGNPSELLYCYQCAGDPVDTYAGNFSHTFTDMSVPGRGLPLDFTRTYNAGAASQNGPLGYGWTDSYNWSLSTDGSGNVTITQENGSTVTFAPDGSGGFTAPSRVLAALVQNGDGSYTFTRLQDQTHYTFNSRGRLTAETDRNGYVTALAYNGGGLLTSVTDPAGRTLTFAYDGSGRITRVTDPASRSVAFSYDGSANLQTATDVSGGVWHFTYDANHLLLTMTDPRGGMVTNVYDGSGRVTSQTDGQNRKTTFSYTGPDGSGNSSTTITDPKGNVTVDQYANALLLVETKGYGTPQAATWSYTYDPLSLGLASVTDPNNNVTYQTWDAAGNLLSRTDPLGRTTTYTYDALNDQLTSTDPNGITTTYTYDAHGNRLSTATPLVGTSQVQTTTYTYGDAGHPGDVTALTDPTGQTWHYTYNADGDRSSSTDPVGDITSDAYNVLGERTAETNPLGATTHTTYDAFGDVTSVTDPLGHTTAYQYDADRNQTQVTDADGNVTQYTYDLDNELTTTTRADGTTLTAAYDDAGNPTSQTDGLGHTTKYAYDPLNRLAATTDPLGRTTTYAYDSAGNRVSQTAPGSLTTAYTYDAANELIGISYSDGVTFPVGYTYDADGQRLSSLDGSGTTTDSYDSLHRLTSETNGAGQAMAYSYDLVGHLTSLTYPSGKTVTRSYDAAGRLSSVADWLGNTNRFAYDKAGELTGVMYANHDLAVLAYNLAGQLVSQSYYYAPCPNPLGPRACGIAWSFRAGFKYTRDAAGLLTSTTTTGISLPAQTDTYTSLQQLASASTTGGGTTSYAYDKADEPTTLGPAALTEDAAGELTQLSVGTLTTNFTYDPRGSRTKATQGSGTTSYAYDQANRLTSYTQGTTTATYAYNGDGLRVRKTVNSGTAEAFTWDTTEGLPLLVQDGTTAFVTGASGLPLEQIDASGHVLYFLQDQLGSTRALADSTGAITATYTYDAYGTTTASTGTASTPLRFAGQYLDAESGLYYLRARYYDSATAQFLTRDPLVPLTGQPYTYAGDDPLNSSDPSGKFLGLENVGSWFDRHAAQISYWAGKASDVVSVVGTACALGALVVQALLVCSLVAGGLSFAFDATKTAADAVAQPSDVGSDALTTALDFGFVVSGLTDADKVAKWWQEGLFWSWQLTSTGLAGYDLYSGLGARAC